MNHLGCVASLKRVMPVLALFGAAACDKAQRGHDVVADAGTASEAPRSNANTNVGPKWLPNQAYTYRLKLASRLSIGEQTPMVEFDLTGDAKLDIRELPDKSLQFSVRLIQPKFIKGSGGADGQFDQLATELKAPFFFTLTAGKLREVRGRAGASRFATSILHTIAAAFQFSGPTKPGALRWATEEIDGTGPYQIEYVVGKSPDQLRRTKQSYGTAKLGSTTLPGIGTELSTLVESSEGSLSFGSASGSGLTKDLLNVEYREHLKTSMGPSATVHSNTSLQLSLLNREPTQTDKDWVSELAASVPLNPRQAGSASADSFDRARIGSFTFASALGALEAEARTHGASTKDDPTSAKASVQAESAAFSAMTALLRSQPSLVAQAEQRVRASSRASNLLLDALGSAGSAQAQQALVSVMNDEKLSEQLRRAAAFSLIRTSTPTPDTLEALKAHTNGGPLMVHALYGLGTMSRHLREAGKSAEASAIVALLVELLGKAESPSHQVHVLRAIANSADSAALPAVKPWLNSSVTKVRAAAVDAIRLMPGEAVERLLAEQFKGNNPEAQLAAMDAMIVREPTALLVKALAEGAANAEKPATRLRAVGLIQKWLPSHPELLPALKEIAKSDVNPHVREAATLALGVEKG